MNDIEGLIKASLDARVDATLGERTRPPRFDPRRTSAPRRATWVMPLLAAACVIVVAGGSIVATQVLSDAPGPRPAVAPSVTPSPSDLPSTLPTAPEAAPTSTSSSIRPTASSASPAATRSSSRPVATAPSPSVVSSPATRTSISARGPAITTSMVVRPVDATGYAVTGYRVVTESGTSVSCDVRSPSAVDPGIATCGSTADYAPSCWRAADPNYVLCLRDPLGRQLVRLRLSGAFSAPAAGRRTPQALILHDSTRCRIALGGAFGRSTQHPDWVVYFTCPDRPNLVYGPRGGNGIDATRSVWTVQLFRGDGTGPGVVHSVRTAYYVGTAG